MTKKSKLVLALASMLGISAGATAVSGFAWFVTTKSANVNITNIGVYSTSSNLDVRLGSPLKGCADNSSAPSNVNLVGGSTAATQTFKATAGQTVFTLDQYAADTPTVTINSEATNAFTWTAGATGKTVTLTDGASLNDTVVISYDAYAALTDISSVDGQTFYKPVWTAGGEGVTATSIENVTNASSGYVSFTITISAVGSDDLDIYLNNPHINPVDGESAADTAAANITRVAFIEETTTNLIIQKATIATGNNTGINSTFAGTPNSGGLWDLSLLNPATATVTRLANLDSTNKNTLSSGTKAASENWVCTVEGGTTKTIKVNIWLEGTSGNQSGNASGEFATLSNPENGMINVQLPLIAFTA